MLTEIFSFSAWGKGASKFVNPNSLGDVIPLAASQPLQTLSGTVAWASTVNTHFPGQLRLAEVRDRKNWLTTSVGSPGNYSVQVAPGKYELLGPDAYFPQGDSLHGVYQLKLLQVMVSAKQQTKAPVLLLRGGVAPHLIPERGVLHNFTPASAEQVDRFITTLSNIF